MFWLLQAGAVTAGLVITLLKSDGGKGGGQILGFCMCALSGLAPACHFTFVATGVEVEMMMYPLFGQCMWYIIGVIFYILKFPEKHLPAGTCDYVLQSHQFWHICVFLAAKAFLDGMLQMHQLSMNHSCEVKKDWPRFWN